MRVLAALALTATIHTAAADESIRLYAAGSLRAVMNEIAAAFTADSGIKVIGEYGPSGTLRERIARGEPADVFAAANMEHPESLARSGKAAAPILFARNTLCALAGPNVRISTATLLDRLLDPALKLGTSTPHADPAGDYAWQLFERAEKLRPGAYKTLSDKARKLTGAPDSPLAPKDKSAYADIVATGLADVFLTYCSNALQAKTEVPRLQIVPLPDELAVSADYGMAVIAVDRPEAQRFARFVLTPRGQDILQRHGFTPVARP